MRNAAPLPATGEVFIDERGGHRTLRVSWHHESALVVLSVWHGNTCAGTVRIAADQVPDLVEALRAGLSAMYDEVRTEVEEAAG